MSNDNHQQKRDSFTSQLGVILAASGSAIGIGNVWRFSYVVGVNGGGAFLLVYLICVVLVGLPLIMAELSIGRNTGKSAFTAFKQIAPRSFWWIAGATGVLAAFLIMTYYPLVAGWSLGYMFESIVNWKPMIADTTTFFNNYVSGNIKPLIMLAIVLIMTALTLVGGVAKGIEKWNKILMPTLVIIIIVLIIRSLTLPGSIEGVKFLFYPDFSKITIMTFLDALGHGFYSLSVGMAIMITYGSYIRKNDDLVESSVTVCALDTVTALMAGLAIFPAVFALGLEPDSGAGLAFITLPKAFATLPGGQIFAILFFLLLTVAALASMMSLLEVLVAFLVDEFGLNKKKVLIILVVLLFLLGIPSNLSFNLMADFKIFGLTYFDLMDKFSANVLVPITGLLTAAFVIFRFGVKNSREELLDSCKHPKGFLIRSYPVLIKYIVPISVIFILLNATGVFSKLFS
ncbi:MAG TPA: sodium-dependent transporter [Clostridiaceae bacterium]|nr:sodium-dependent transporter [Clostridiaceae bacterium]